MQISPHHPSLRAAEEAQNGVNGHGAKQPAPAPADGGTNPAGDPAVVVELSDEAQELLGSEKAAHSTAHQARLYIEGNPEHGFKNFGQVVSQFARGLLSLSAPAPAVEVTPPEETIAALPEDPVEETPVPAPAETGATDPAGDETAVEPPVPLVEGEEVIETETEVDETIAELTPPVVALETPDILDLLADEEAGPET